MSARSIIRAREREQAREQRRISRRAKQVSTGAALAIGAGLAFAPGAQAANFTVNSNADGPATACDATCTLRDAVDAANADATPDVITFAPTVTGEIELDPGEGGLPISSAMTIQGPGASSLAVDGNGGTQLMYVEPDLVGADFDAVTISGLTLRDGNSGSDSGAAIYAEQANTTLDSVVVSGNISTGGQGAVYMEGGELTVTDSTFRANSARGGGAIYTDDDNGPATGGTSRLVIRNSTFVGNSAPGSNNGGAVYVDDETDSALITGSTFSGNSAGSDGGAIVAFGVETGAFRLENSTVTGNTAGENGGGIYVYNEYDKATEIVNSTITNNSAGGSGGGIYHYAYDKTETPVHDGVGDVTLSSTIVAGNDAATGPDLANRVQVPPNGPVTGTFLTGFSLIGDTADAPITEQPTGSNVLNADPQLGGLADNGGPTKTILPAESSPVIDAGTANGLTVDQRGLPRTVRKTFTLPPGGDGTDIGAVELQDEGLTGATVKAEKKQRLKGKKVVVVVQAGADEDVKAVASGSVKAGKASAKLKKVKKTVTGGKLKKLKLVASGKKGKAVAKAIDDGKKGKAKLKVVLTDPAGNKETAKPKVTLKG